MSTLLEQIANACSRSGGPALGPLAARSRDKAPAELASPLQLARRRRFLGDSLGDEGEAARVFERILQGNELQDANYLARGARAARSVARIAIVDAAGAPAGWGTGFLIAPSVLITNNHVLPDAATAGQSVAQFGYERDIDGAMQPPVPFALRPGDLYFSSVERDFTVVAVEPASLDGRARLADYGYLPLVANVGKVAEGEWLTIVQHPGGNRKQLCVRENQLIRIDDDVLWYSTDTSGGSSGSPVHNNDWYVVALHHAGVPVTIDGRIQTVDGRDFDPARDSDASIKWIANEGIRVSRIVEELRAHRPGHRLLQPVFDTQPAQARLLVPQGVILRSAPRIPLSAAPPASPPTEIPMDDHNGAAERRITLTLGLSADGRVRVLADGRESAPAEAARRATERLPAFDLPFDADYSKRKGYDPAFLGAGPLQVLLPALGADAELNAARLLPPANNSDYVLNYHNYSVVMNAKRRLAIYSAANVDFAGRHDLARPADVWRTDPRIRADHQLGNFYYRKNRFDRGHLTRREDLEFGHKRAIALASAADTCHWTNCTPQQEVFNQRAPYWQGIERYLLEDRIERESFKAQIITGPVLSEDDPVWDAFPKIPYPSRFWKVVAALDAEDKLFATAYLLDQTPLIDKHGIEAAREPFGAYGTPTYQVPIAEIEGLTGLSFWRGGDAPGQPPRPLSDVDPLRDGGPRRDRSTGRARPRAQESLGRDEPAGYRLLESLDSIYLGPG